MAAGGQGFPRGVFATIIANQANIRPPETASRSKELIVVNQRDIGLWCASFGVSLASQTLSPCVRVRLARLFGVGFVRDRYRPLILSPQQSKRFNYKVTILNSTKRGKKPITRQLHHFDGKFRSVTDVKVHLMEELGDEVPSTIHFDVGYYEKRSNKCWLVTSEDLDGMYSSIKSDDISLWCDAETQGPSDKKSEGKGRRKTGASSSKLEEDNVDKHFRILTEKHGDTYSVPQRRLWARTLHCGTHDSHDTPPTLPMFGPPPKRQKKEGFTDAMTNAAVAFAQAISPSVQDTPKPQHQVQSPVVISPAKSVDLRMKNLQQLRYVQQLFEDNILTQEEYIEQKRSILDSLRKL